MSFSMVRRMEVISRRPQVVVNSEMFDKVKREAFALDASALVKAKRARL